MGKEPFGYRAIMTAWILTIVGVLANSMGIVHHVIWLMALGTLIYIVALSCLGWAAMSNYTWLLRIRNDVANGAFEKLFEGFMERIGFSKVDVEIPDDLSGLQKGNEL